MTTGLGDAMSLASRNLEVNAAVDRDPHTTTIATIVNDQNGVTGRLFVYGAYPARHNACEAIAVHNAKLLKGVPSSLSQTINDFQCGHAMIGRGFLGSNVLAIGRILSASGLSWRRVGLRDLADKGLYIISFWNGRIPWDGIHTVTVRHDGQGYTTYNLAGDGRVSQRSPVDYAKSYICGYRLD